ncbi:MAG: GTP-binding protein [Promethearchaeia archaeon]
MPRHKEISEILKIMENREQIRNIGFVGHIDHGKTTLSDSLLSEAGLLSPDLAGEARALDFLEEEQKRGITMKSANISLYYEKSLKETKPFLINLVDTPGHLDFSGKVTRALRLIDGVIVVVDAVEEIISQSETVIKQALQEGVKPILYINKVDRLIRELKLNDEEIKEKFSRIIKDFNTLIERFAEPPYDKDWKVAITEGNVAFGSALHRWGFTYKTMQKSDLKFEDIRRRYEDENTADPYGDLPIYLSITDAVLGMVVQHLPNPNVAQEYRIKKIWDGPINSNIGKAMRKCDPNGPLIICLSKVQVDNHGLVATGRIFSGTCTKKKEILLMRENKIERIRKLAIFMGQRREHVDRIPVGNIVALEALKKVKSGETLVETGMDDSMLPFENVKYVSTPVVTVSIEPEYLRQIDEMKEIIENLLIEDPNLKFEINEDTGQYLLSGMGPLHLEVTAHEIEKRGVEISMSEPRAVFKESCRHSSSVISSYSSEEQNVLKLKVERLNDKVIKTLRDEDLQKTKAKKRRKSYLKGNTSLSEVEIAHLWNIDSDQNILINLSDSEVSKEHRKEILEIIEKIHLNGPLCGERLTSIKITILDLTLYSIDEETLFTELSTLFYDAIKRALKDAELILLEPIYRTVIQLPSEYVKKATSVFSKHQAKINKIDQENEYQTTIEIFLPVRNSINFAEDLRSFTSGKAFWQNEFYTFREVPSQEAKRIISDLKFIKGLSW